MSKATEYLTSDEVAARLRAGYSTIRAWIASGKIPPDAYIRPGRRYLFKADAIARLEGLWA